jgi:hypothetical protein
LLDRCEIDPEGYFRRAEQRIRGLSTGAGPQEALDCYAVQENCVELPHFPSKENSCPNALNREVVVLPMFSVEFTG